MGGAVEPFVGNVVNWLAHACSQGEREREGGIGISSVTVTVYMYIPEWIAGSTLVALSDRL